MIRFDLERFVISGRIDPFSFESTRTEIESVLGEADECAYSDFATYGPVCFDLGNGIAPLHRIQILIPHPSHMKSADPAWTNWTPPNFLENWPDERFAWNVGRFKPGFNINDAIRSLPTFEECEMIMSTNGCRILHNSDSGVMLSFENTEDADVPTLTCITGNQANHAV